MLKLYNTLTRQKEDFQPLNPPFVGMYVCGPTVYGPAHLGHARPYVTFDVLVRYLRHLGYKVRYVRNITDVGHLEDEVEGVGQDRIQKRARLEKLEPMEIVKLYTDEFHDAMDKLNNLRPSIEPNASGHILEQIEIVKKIIENGYAYESNGSVYFNVIKYAQTHDYGKLSGRIIEDLIAGAGNERRELEGQDEKQNPADFALWKKASPEHIMHWGSPWSEGFPGWHIECSAMSKKYLGETFDIHGGGMDLLFPHHESEIAQSKGSCGHAPVKYWMHNNMITINGQKMGRSLNNFINLQQFFTGDHPLLQQAISPLTIRFYMLQAHYRSTADFNNDSLLAAQKGLLKLTNGYKDLRGMEHLIDNGELIIDNVNQPLNEEIISACKGCHDAMDDDLNTAIVVAHLFTLNKVINNLKSGAVSLNAISKENFALLKETYMLFYSDILGLKEETETNLDEMMQTILEGYAFAKENKAFDVVDRIRARAKKQGIIIKDSKSGFSWGYDE